ncbi:MAG TPA: hypothetical protein DEF42_13045 [Desulfosporosinus sp.]|nr:hypothetical protein [Desulfosporosinus sp.]
MSRAIGWIGRKRENGPGVGCPSGPGIPAIYNNPAWRNITIYWFIWMVVPGTIALGLTWFILSNWEQYRHASPTPAVMPYETRVRPYR